MRKNRKHLKTLMLTATLALITPNQPSNNFHLNINIDKSKNISIAQGDNSNITLKL